MSYIQTMEGKGQGWTDNLLDRVQIPVAASCDMYRSVLNNKDLQAFKGNIMSICNQLKLSKPTSKKMDNLYQTNEEMKDIQKAVESLPWATEVYSTFYEKKYTGCWQLYALLYFEHQPFWANQRTVFDHDEEYPIVQTQPDTVLQRLTDEIAGLYKVYTSVHSSTQPFIIEMLEHAIVGRCVQGLQRIQTLPYLNGKDMDIVNSFLAIFIHRVFQNSKSSHHSYQYNWSYVEIFSNGTLPNSVLRGALPSKLHVKITVGMINIANALINNVEKIQLPREIAETLGIAYTLESLPATVKEEWRTIIHTSGIPFVSL